MSKYEFLLVVLAFMGHCGQKKNYKRGDACL